MTRLWIIAVLAFLAALSFRFHVKPDSDFDFRTGLVRCGVAGLSVSCGSHKSIMQNE